MPAVATPPPTRSAAGATAGVAPAGQPSVAMRRLGTLLVLLAAGLVATSTLGPAIGDWIRYPVTTTLLNQTIGLDVVSLVVVAPVCAAIGILALRGHRAAPLQVWDPACAPPTCSRST